VLDGYEYRYEKDSMFLWLRLPDEQAAAEFEKSAAGFGVNIVSSEKFAVGGSVPPNYIRISLSGAENRKELHKGLTVIQRLLDGEIGSPEGIL
ncbi:PLP-dependent aminotransferase family protein, partial [Candidatus Saccharibacteria bacterium]|nr:PLP-dependent aminotransferase family protein [Candidatus Saccharibacteria bacterium]